MSDVNFSLTHSATRAFDRLFERADDVDQLLAEAAFESVGAIIQPPDAEGRYILAAAGPGLAQGLRPDAPTPDLDDAIGDAFVRKLQEGD